MTDLKPIFSAMIDSQIRINDLIRPAWQEENLAWSRPIWTEASEGVGHLGWEWWKKMPVDIAQARLELVDVLHFAISHECMFLSPEALAENMAESYKIVLLAHEVKGAVDGIDLIGLFDSLAYEALKSRYGHGEVKERAFDPVFFHTLFHAMTKTEMDIDQIALMYLGKNTLNLFRQNNGDRERAYPRLWDGIEDNQHLTEIILLLREQGSPINLETLYVQLGDRFTSIHGSDYKNQFGWFSKQEPAF